MDRLHLDEPPEPSATDGGIDAIRDRFEHVIGGERAQDVDVRAYLLDPPPSPEDAARDTRRRLLVRRASSAVAALVALALILPWPGGEPGRPAAVSASTETAPADAQVQVQPAVERVDVAPSLARQRPRARARDGVPRRRAAVTPVPPTPTAPSTSVPQSTTPSRAPNTALNAPRAEASNAAPAAAAAMPIAGDAGVLVPVS